MPGLQPLAFIGASQEKLEQLPGEWRELFTQVAASAAQQGRPVHTGAAPGGEQLAAETALGAGGTVRLFLPWAKFEAAWIKEMQARHGERVSLTVFSRELHPKWDAWVREHYPGAQALGPKARRLVSRIGGVVEGCAGVVALPPGEAERTGGTGYGIRLAKELGIEVWDLSRPYPRWWWTWWLGCRAMTGEEFKMYLANLDPSRFRPGVLEQARRLAEIMPEDTGPWSVAPYERLLRVTWRGHHCRLEVIVHPDGYEKSPSFPEPGVDDPRAWWMFTDVAEQLAYLRDSVTAGSLGLTVSEWRAMREQTLP